MSVNIFNASTNKLEPVAGGMSEADKEQLDSCTQQLAELDYDNLIVHSDVKCYSISQQNSATTSGTSVTQTFALPSDLTTIKKLQFIATFTDGLGSAKLDSYSINGSNITVNATIKGTVGTSPCSWGMQIYYV